MQTFILTFVILFLTLIGFILGKRRSVKISNGGVNKLHSLPGYYGLYVAMWCSIPAVIFLALWLSFENSIITTLIVSDLPDEMKDLPPDRMSLIVNDIKNLAEGNIVSKEPDEALKKAALHYSRLKEVAYASLFTLIMIISTVFGIFTYRKIQSNFRARNKVEKIMEIILIASSTVAIFTTIGIVLSVLFESIRFFRQIPVFEFLLGLKWSPQMAIRPDQVGASGSFGIIPLVTGTMLISFIAMVVAVPIGLMSAIYMSEYASYRTRAIVKPLLEILAGIPTVVYGFFAALTVAPFIRDTGALVGLDVSSESALAAGLVMGVMIIPFVSSLSDDVINAVPQSMRDGSYAIGATQSETIIRVLLQAALPGIVGSVLLAVSRAIGETMIVVMAAGLTANLTGNPFEAVTTFTVQIVTLLIGDQEFDSPKTLAAFALGLILFIMTLCLNIVALYVVRKYREQYE